MGSNRQDVQSAPIQRKRQAATVLATPRGGASGLALVVVFILPLLMGNDYQLTLLALIGIYTIAATGLNIVYGLGGLITWAQAAFMGIGAYAGALVCTRLSLPVVVGFFVATVVAAGIGLVIGVAGARLTGHYFGIATIAFAIVFQETDSGWQSLTGGVFGLGNIPAIGIGRSSAGVGIRGSVYVIFGVAVGCLLLQWYLARSKTGLLVNALRDDPLAARCFGVSTSKYYALLFAAGAGCAGAAGALYAYFSQYISPDSFTITQALTLFAMVLIGGRGTLIGPALGAAVLTLVPQLIDTHLELVYAVEGLLIVLFIIFLPDGLVSLPRRIHARAGALRGSFSGTSRNKRLAGKACERRRT